MSAPQMRTVSLRRRVVLAGLGVVTSVLLALNVFVYLSLQHRMEENLRDVLEDRVRLAEELAPDLLAEELAEQLSGGGVVARVLEDGDGEQEPVPSESLPFDPADDEDEDEGEDGPGGPPFARGELPGGNGPPPWAGPGGEQPTSVLSNQVQLADGSVVELSVSRAGVDDALNRLLLLQAAGTALALVLVAGGLRWAAASALRPLDHVVDTARGIGARMREPGGQNDGAGTRLRPDNDNTELGRMAVAFDEMLDAIDAALTDERASGERSRQFLADAAHQIRTPLAGIAASAEALGRASGAEREMLATNLALESRRAGALVRDLLQIARLDAGVHGPRSEVDLAALGRQEAERARAALTDGSSAQGAETSGSAASSAITVAFRGPETLVLHAEEAAVHGALANLVDNALRHARTEVVIEVAEMAPEVASVRVRDDGEGVAASDRERIFERFTSLDGRGGSGLGLAIARSVARAHGGDVTCDGDGFLLTLRR